MLECSKLVRRKVVDDMIRNGKSPTFFNIPDDKMMPELDDKLLEEFNELQVSRDSQDLYDVFEVVRCMAIVKGYTEVAADPLSFYGYTDVVESDDVDVCFDNLEGAIRDLLEFKSVFRFSRVLGCMFDLSRAFDMCALELIYNADRKRIFKGSYVPGTFLVKVS